MQCTDLDGFTNLDHKEVGAVKKSGTGSASLIKSGTSSTVAAASTPATLTITPQATVNHTPVAAASGITLASTSAQHHSTTLPNGNHPATLTVVSSGAPASGATKTIVVVPVSSHGSGDAQPIKKLKTL